MGEVSCYWLQDVGGRNRVVVLQEPALQLLEAFGVFGQFGQKKLKLSLRDETRKIPGAVPVSQEALWSPKTQNTKVKVQQGPWDLHLSELSSTCSLSEHQLSITGQEVALDVAPPPSCHSTCTRFVHHSDEEEEGLTTKAGPAETLRQVWISCRETSQSSWSPNETLRSPQRRSTTWTGSDVIMKKIRTTHLQVQVFQSGFVGFLSQTGLSKT